MDNKVFFITIYDKLRCDRVLKMDKSKLNDPDLEKMIKQCNEESEQFKKYQFLHKRIIKHS